MAPRESDDETAQLIPIDQTEPADGVKVGGLSNYFPWEWPEPEEESPAAPLFPWALFVWVVLAVMGCAAIGAAVSGL